MAVEVRDVALEHYSASAVLVRFKTGDKIWLPLSQINQVPIEWPLPPELAARRGKYLVITDWIAKQKGFKVTPRELDIDPERAAEKLTAPAQAAKPETAIDAAVREQMRQLEGELRSARTALTGTRASLEEARSNYAQARADLRNAEAQRDKALADLALAQDALRKANERADKAEAYIAAQGRTQHLPPERFALLEME